MKIARALLAGVSLLAPGAWAGEVSNVAGTLDTTLVDPAPGQYPHFVCASGCSSFNGAVTQSGAWTVGISNFPATQAVTGTVNITNFPATQTVTGSVNVGNLPAVQSVSASSLPLPAGAATAANQPAINGDGGGLAHITNFPASQAVTGAVNITNFPATQTVTGSVSVGNLPAVQAVSASSLPLPAGAATAANQPAINGDGGGLAHITNFPVVQSIAGSVGISGSIPYGGNHLGSVAIDVPLPGFANPPTVNVGNAALSVTGSAGAFSDGWNPTEGSTTDAAWTSGAGSLVALLKANVTALNGMLSALNAPTPSGSNLIGSVSINASGNTTQSQGYTEWQSASAENCHAYGSPATVYSLGGYANQAEWVLVYNTTSTPADGSATPPTWWYYIPQSGSWTVSWTPAPRTMTTGDTVCYSSTGPFTKTSTGLTVGSNSFFGQRQ